MDFFHVLNRGLHKQPTFLDDGDRLRFVQSLYVCNDLRPVPNGITQHKLWNNLARERDCLVKIHAWCLMGNHYHLLVSPVEDDITKLSLFMKKLNGGYAKFFNEKYERFGYFWQGKYKRIRIERNSQFMYIPYYIHLNPLDIEHKSWRTGNLTEVHKPIQFLDNYRWSSWPDYTGTKNFPSILYPDILREILGSKDQQISEIKRIVSDSYIANNAQMIET